MADLIETAEWVDGIYQIETTDPVVGGPPNLALGQGISNVQAQQLARRTAFLKASIGGLGGTANSSADIDALDATGMVEITSAATGNPAPGYAGALFHTEGTSGKARQLCVSDNGRVYSRLRTDADPTWTPWVRVVDDREGVGTVIMFTGATPPAGHLDLAGYALSRTAYSDLWAHAQASTMYDPTGAELSMFGPGDGASTFTIPDWRGEFPRAWDDGRGVDVGRALGSAQTDAVQDHTHRMRGYSGGSASNFLGLGLGNPSGSAYHWSGVDGPAGTGTGVMGVQTGTGGLVGHDVRSSAENRPRNVATMFCIKF